jgi:hypothetical protein
MKEKKRFFKCVDKGYRQFHYNHIYAYDDVQYLVSVHPEDWVEIVDYTGTVCPTSLIEKNSFDEDLKEILDAVYKLLIDKNKKYGNSALNPVRIFSKTNKVEQLKVRIDDKLSRIAKGSDNEDEDVVNDLIGYLVLLKMSINGKT